jgi:predicted Zn-ribbon and HTH transcriptional regulator
MSADNKLLIFKIGKKYYATMRFLSDNKYLRNLNLKKDRIIFTANSLKSAIKKANEETHEEIYEYGYAFMESKMKIKKCPFCKGNKIAINLAFAVYYFECQNSKCHITTMIRAKTKKKAITVWNKRTK